MILYSSWPCQLKTPEDGEWSGVVQVQGKLSGFAAVPCSSAAVYFLKKQMGKKKPGTSAIRSIRSIQPMCPAQSGAEYPNNALKSAGKWLQLGPVGSKAEGNGQNSWVRHGSEMIYKVKSISLWSMNSWDPETHLNFIRLSTLMTGCWSNCEFTGGYQHVQINMTQQWFNNDRYMSRMLLLQKRFDFFATFPRCDTQTAYCMDFFK